MGQQFLGSFQWKRNFLFLEKGLFRSQNSVHVLILTKMCDTLFFWKGIHQNIWFKFFHFISFLQLLTSSFLNFFEWHSLFYQESKELKRAMWTFLTFQKVRSFDLAQYKRNISTHSIYLISGNKEVKIKGRGYGGPVVINTLVRCKFFQWVFFYGYRYQVPSVHPTTSFQTFMIIYLPSHCIEAIW